MEVTASTYSATNKSASQTYNDVSNSFINNSFKLSEILGIKVDDKTDALEAIKQDPAVLEAQITVNTGNRYVPEPSIPHDEASILEDDSSQSKGTFEEMVSMQEAALLSLTPHQLEFLMKYTEALRKRRFAVQKYLECAFCKNNGESVSWYTAHSLKDGRGRVRCPVLRGFRCPRCGATGDRAHTIKYCPGNYEFDN